MNQKKSHYEPKKYHTMNQKKYHTMNQKISHYEPKNITL